MALRIDFYHDALNKLDVAARITQKAHAAGHRLLIVAPEPSIRDAIDRLLWTFLPLSFVPHCLSGHALEAETPVVLADRVTDLAGRPPDLLINLGQDLPAGYERFERLIEIVGQDDDDRQPARERFRQYRAAGHEVTSHRLGEKS